jgi:hypothetical protein
VRYVCGDTARHRPFTAQYGLGGPNTSTCSTVTDVWKNTGLPEQAIMGIHDYTGGANMTRRHPHKSYISLQAIADDDCACTFITGH